MNQNRTSAVLPLERLLMRDERDTRLESRGTFIMPQSPLPLLLVKRMWGKAALFIILDTFECVDNDVITLLCAFALRLL